MACNYCPKCGYTGNVMTCPECAQPDEEGRWRRVLMLSDEGVEDV